MIKNTFLAYSAGYTDGDGCFYINKHTINNGTKLKFRAQFIIASAHKKVLDVIKNKFNGVVITPKQSIDKLHQKKVNYLCMGKNDGTKFIEQIQKYLIERKEESEIFLNFCASKDNQVKQALINQMDQFKKLSNLVYKEQKEQFELLKNTIKPTKNDYAYLAGFIDAECCLGIQKYKPKGRPNYVYKILLQCNNTKAPVFKWLLERFGGHINFIDRNTKNPSEKNQFTWRLSSNALAKIINKIYPFLIHKKPVCNELINFYKTTIDNGGDRNSDKFRNNYDSIIKRREEIVNNVHILNLKGI